MYEMVKGKIKFRLIVSGPFVEIDVANTWKEITWNKFVKSKDSVRRLVRRRINYGGCVYLLESKRFAMTDGVFMYVKHVRIV